MDSVGELLRGERLRQRLELAEIAERTKINPTFLQAIEAGDTESLPGAFFYRAFVRQYARALSLDEGDLEPALAELRIKADTAQSLPSPQEASPAIAVPPIPTPFAQRRFSGPKASSIILLVAVIVGCSGIYALWQRSRETAPQAPPPVRRGTLAPPPKPQTAAQEPAVAFPAPEAPKPSVPRVAEQSITAAAPAPASPAVNAKLDIEVAASELVWFSATTDGRKTTTVLKEGQSRRFACNDRATLFVGNAGGLDIRVNGKSVGPVGPRGHLRTVVITPDGVTIANPREKKEEPNPQ